MKKKTLNSIFNILIVNAIEDASGFGGLITFGLLILIMLGKSLNLAIEATAILVIIYIIVYTIRKVYFKNRPKKMSYNNNIEKIDASSFPSMHSARIFSLATFIFLNFALNLYLSLIIGVIAILTAIARLLKKKHDYIDVTVGAVIGIVIAVIIHAVV